MSVTRTMVCKYSIDCVLKACSKSGGSHAQKQTGWIHYRLPDERPGRGRPLLGRGARHAGARAAGKRGSVQATRGCSSRLGHRGAEGEPRQPRAPRYRNRRYRRRGPPAGKIGCQAGTGRPYLVGHGGTHRAAVLRGTRNFKVVRGTSHEVVRVGTVQSLSVVCSSQNSREFHIYHEVKIEP